jgi:hypothetical protein
MENITLTWDDITKYVIYFNILLGILFGTLPLIVGLLVKDTRFAVLGFILTVIGGGIIGVFLSYPLAIVFLVLIVRRNRKGATPLPDGL